MIAQGRFFFGRPQREILHLRLYFEPKGALPIQIERREPVPELSTGESHIKTKRESRGEYTRPHDHELQVSDDIGGLKSVLVGGSDDMPVVCTVGAETYRKELQRLK